MPVLDIDHQLNAEKEEVYFEKIYDKDLGAMYLVYDKALVVRSSSRILFFKLVLDKFTLV